MDKKVPKHIAIIPDGNRRWARQRGLMPWLGHKAGFARFQEVAEKAFKSGCQYVTIWGASVDNLRKRSSQEVGFLVLYMKRELGKKKLAEYLVKNQIRFRVIGEWQKAVRDQRLGTLIERLEKQTGRFSGRQLTILFGYDGISEMLSAVRSLRGTQRENLDYLGLKEKLWTKNLPEVDLVVRTGGEPHWSAGFMMWLTANSQLYFTDIFWPEFSGKELAKALADYDRRERRFGK